MAREKICGIYKIENLVNGKVYIGSSIDINKRWRHHITNLEGNRHCNKHLQGAWNKYGKDNFEFKILEEIKEKDKEIILEKEQYWLDLLKPFDDNGYNLCKNTNSYSFGHKMPDGTIEKLKNRKYTKEHKQKMSDNHAKKVKIVQLSLDGDLIKVWDSLTEASKTLKLHKTSISGCLQREKTNRLSAKGYIWLSYNDYKSNNFKNIIEDIVSKINKRNYMIPIIQLSLDNKFIKQWNSASEAGSSLNIDPSHIRQCCKGEVGTAYSYKWAYLDDYNNNSIPNFKHSTFKPIVQLDLQGNFIREWSKVKDISDELGFNYHSIREVCQGKTKTNVYKKFRWVYKENYEKLIS